MDFFFLENVRGSPHHSFCVFLIEKIAVPLTTTGRKNFSFNQTSYLKRNLRIKSTKDFIPKSKRFIYTQMELAKEVVSLVKGSS